IQHHCIELFLVFQQALERRLAIGRKLRRVSFGLEIEAQASGEMSFVLYHQHAAHARLRGSSSVTVVPRPAPSLSAKTFPPCARAMARTMNRPSPVPFTCGNVRRGTR